MVKRLFWLSVAALPLGGCRCSGGEAAPVASASVSAQPEKQPFPVGAPNVTPEEVAKVVNGGGKPPYTGPVGTVKGTIRVEGDPPPDVVVKAPAGKCGEALATYGKLFRTGNGGTLADAIVGVIGYEGFVPADGEAVKVTIHGCAFDRRSVVLTYGQRLEVFNQDTRENYMPYLEGAPTKAQIIAIPGGLPVKLYPPKPGRYVLKDFLKHDFMAAEVVTLAYATAAVTGLDGTFTIKGVPVGKVQVSAVLPAIGKSVDKAHEVKEGENVVDLVMKYTAPPPKDEPAKDDKKDEKKGDDAKKDKGDKKADPKKDPPKKP